MQDYNDQHRRLQTVRLVPFSDQLDGNIGSTREHRTDKATLLVCAVKC